MPFVGFYRDRTVFWNPGDGNAPAGGLLDRTAKEVRNPLIVEACEVPRSLKDLMERAGVSHRSHFRRKHLKPLLEAGLVRMTNPGNPRVPNQRYVVTDARLTVG